MKLALLLTGQLRTNELVRHMHYHRLLAPYDVDVFLSIDPDNSRQNEFENPVQPTADDAVQEAIAFYRPKRYTVCTLSLDEMVAVSEHPEEKRHLLSTFPYAALVLRQYYVVQQAYKLLAETPTNYDLVIRLRFDQLLFNDAHDIHTLLAGKSQIVCTPTTLEMTKALAPTLPPLRLQTTPRTQLQVFGYGPYLHYFYVNDQFWCHAPALSSVMAGFYDALPRLTAARLAADNRNTGAFIESLLHNYLEEQGVEPVRTTVGGVFVRGL